MARKKKGELPSGSIRKRVFIGYEYVVDDNGKPVIDPKTKKQKKKRLYESVTASTKKDAEIMAAEIKVKSASSSTRDSGISFEKARENYINSKEKVLSETTIRGYKQMNTYYGMLDTVRIKDLNDINVQEWINTFMSNHSVKTVLNAYGLLSAVCRSYKTSFDVTLPKKEIKEVYVPSDDDVKKIVSYFKEKPDNDMVIAICLAAFGTLRRSEICGLSSDDVNGSVIHVSKSVVINKDNELISRNKVKNASSDRYIEFPQFVIAMLPKEGPLVSIAPDNITKRFHAGLNKSGIPIFRFHDLRHYSASIMHAIGIPDVYIMDRGGWKTDEVLKRIYRGTIEDYKKQFVEQTNAHFETLHHDLHHESR